MNTEQLRCVIQCDPCLHDRVVGVFAIDEINNVNLCRGSSLICNTQPKRKQGEHWIAMYMLPNGTMEFFDSLGRKPMHVSFRFETFIRKHTPSYLYNSKRLQGESSNVCGQYCLYYLLHRCRGVSLHGIVNTFYDNYYANDLFVSDFMFSSFPYCV